MADNPDSEMDLSDRLAFADLQHRYGDTVSRRAWVEFEQILAADCRLELALKDRDLVIDGASEIAGFVSRAVARFDVFLFAVLNSVTGPGPSGRMWIQELRWVGDVHTTAYGLYDDTFAKGEDGVWRIASRCYTSISGGRYRS